MSSHNTFIQLLVGQLTFPGSNYYLSNLLHDPSGKSADPLNISRIDLGTLDPKPLDLDVGIALENVVIHGLSDVQVNLVNGIPDVQVNGDTVTFSGKMPNTQDDYTRPSDVPDHIIMQGSVDSTIDGDDMPPGSLSVSMKTASLTGSFRLTGEHVNAVVVTFTSLKVSADCTPDNIQIDIKLDTSMVDIIQQILNLPDQLKAILAEANKALADARNLANLSNYATQAARGVLADIMAAQG